MATSLTMKASIKGHWQEDVVAERRFLWLEVLTKKVSALREPTFISTNAGWGDRQGNRATSGEAAFPLVGEGEMEAAEEGRSSHVQTAWRIRRSGKHLAGRRRVTIKGKTKGSQVLEFPWNATKGETRTIHDGGGLCSPGRCPIEGRKELAGKKGIAVAACCRSLFLKWILEQGKRPGDAVKDISGPWQGGRWRAPQSTSSCLGPGSPGRQVEISGFSPGKEGRRPRLRGQLQEASGYGEGESGWKKHVSCGVRLRLGVDMTMPRVPAVFEEKEVELGLHRAAVPGLDGRQLQVRAEELRGHREAGHGRGREGVHPEGVRGGSSGWIQGSPSSSGLAGVQCGEDSPRRLVFCGRQPQDQSLGQDEVSRHWRCVRGDDVRGWARRKMSQADEVLYAIWYRTGS